MANLSEKEQADWLANAFGRIKHMPDVIGVNYWVNVGGETALWDVSEKPTAKVEVMRNFYSDKAVSGKVLDSQGKAIPFAQIVLFDKVYTASQDGTYTLPFFYSGQVAQVQAEEYTALKKTFAQPKKNENISLVHSSIPQNEVKKKSLWDQIIDFILNR